MYSGDGERGGGRAFGFDADNVFPFPFHLSSSGLLGPLDALVLVGGGSGCVTGGLARPDSVWPAPPAIAGVCERWFSENG